MCLSGVTSMAMCLWTEHPGGSNGMAISPMNRCRALQSGFGHVATANQNTFPPDFPYRVSGSFADKYRIEQIHALLGAKSKLTVDDMLAVQKDVYAAYDKFLAQQIVQLHPGQRRKRSGLRWIFCAAGTARWTRTKPLRSLPNCKQQLSANLPRLLLLRRGEANVRDADA